MDEHETGRMGMTIAGTEMVVSEDAMDGERINKREFLGRVAARSGFSQKDTGLFYEAMIEELVDAVSEGQTVMLTGFGRFYRQAHKGHKVRFGQQAIDDYSVLKFSASKPVNRQIHGEIVVMPATDGEEA